MLTHFIGFMKNIFGARKEVHELPDHPSYMLQMVQKLYIEQFNVPFPTWLPVQEYLHWVLWDLWKGSQRQAAVYWKSWKRSRVLRRSGSVCP